MPSPRALSRWALVMALVLPFVGALFYFVDWGVFAGKQRFGMFLWGYAVVAFVTGITGSRIGLPAYWIWMGIVFVIGTVIGVVALTVVFFLVVTPMAMLGRAMGRDPLHLRADQQNSYWEIVRSESPSHPEKQF